MERASAVYLRDGYAGKGKGLDGWYRDLTVGEAKRLTWHATLYAVDRTGKVRECRVNGAPKTWKTRTGCVLSLKYGLKECFRVGRDDAHPCSPISACGDVRIVVPIVNCPLSEECPAEIAMDWAQEHALESKLGMYA